MTFVKLFLFNVVVLVGGGGRRSNEALRSLILPCLVFDRGWEPVWRLYGFSDENTGHQTEIQVGRRKNKLSAGKDKSSGGITSCLAQKQVVCAVYKLCGRIAKLCGEIISRGSVL